MYKKKLLDTYGHVHMRYIHEDEIYYFQNANAMDPEIIIATEFIPNLLTPQTTLPLIEFDFILGSRVEGKITIYDQVYEIPLKEMLG